MDDEEAAKVIADAREFLDPEVGYAWTSDWDERQAGSLMKRLLEALEARA